MSVLDILNIAISILAFNSLLMSYFLFTTTRRLNKAEEKIEKLSSALLYIVTMVEDGVEDNV